ncbi:hypothetical protein JOB18_035768 [Solea senegalensis]|uniref:Uncharacterized protein n=1 Tax=Solea senegalensis TaxID=28829 RepID=A0AAV6QE90_SOLSE|nr:hypothetical protein JOB18_035768 [Solea senegalensis]
MASHGGGKAGGVEVEIKGAGETRAKSPTAHNTQAAEPTETRTAFTRTTRTTTTTDHSGTDREKRRRGRKFCHFSPVFFWEVSSERTGSGGNGSEPAFVSGKPESFFLSSSFRTKVVVSRQHDRLFALREP